MMGAKQALRKTLAPCRWTCSFSWYLAEGYKTEISTALWACGSESTLDFLFSCSEQK